MGWEGDGEGRWERRSVEWDGEGGGRGGVGWDVEGLVCTLVWSSVPCMLQDAALVRRMERLSDSVVRLESFVGSGMEGNPLYKDYHGEE